ncbi:diguanylate cyclase [Reinekea sp.]|jgi:diguanylate cyclase (GGDEF)-like protein|uniref:diguanylate cyclase n=1 Tax=Reinekea sp. TaxID=1970455 RepID=UPI0039898A03
MLELAQLDAGQLKEQQRLKAVNSLKFGNAEVQERLDRITRIAKRMFAVAMADFSLITETDQQVVSVSGSIQTKTPRDISFSEFALYKHEVFYVADTQKDDRFADFPQVISQPKIRFFATCPVHTKNGQRVGALTIADSSPRTFSAHDQSVLKDLAEMFENELSFASLATIDRSTKMVMNQGFFALAEQSLKVCERNKTPAVAIVFDIISKPMGSEADFNRVKEKNIKVFADQLRRLFRKSDVVGRLGGDEFTALLLNARTEQVSGMVRTLQTSIDLYNQENDSQSPIQFTHAIAEFDPENPTRSDALVERAYQSSKKVVGF